MGENSERSLCLLGSSQCELFELSLFCFVLVASSRDPVTEVVVLNFLAGQPPSSSIAFAHSLYSLHPRGSM